MIKLFITDIDGCIAHPFKSPDWEAISRIKELNRRSMEEEHIPALTICTGRPLPYAEAVAQWIGIEIPFLFESGGGMYDVRRNILSWNPKLSPEAEAAIAEMKKWLNETILVNYEGTIAEFTKHTDAGLINPDPGKIIQMKEEIQDHVYRNYDLFEVHDTDVSVNVILKTTNKGEGIRYLCDHLETDLSEVAYIGDSSGDIPGLEIVAHSFAPSNAQKKTRDTAMHQVGEATSGVLEAYEMLVRMNADDRRSPMGDR
ncbi:HAD hydrolase family protein [Balneola sp. MJW-20]|uniref:HAD hydrolase family protein n=1 Tax=Gracilimonas aurantiaca TaxID=3234185 RepID=UPI00346614EE